MATEDRLAPTSVDRSGRWKLFTAVACILSVAALITAAYALISRPKPSSEFLLRDTSGRARIRMAATDEGGAIELLDQDGRTRIELRQENRTFSIALLAAKTDRRIIRLWADDSDVPSVLLETSLAGAGGLSVSGPDGRAAVGSKTIGVRAFGRTAELSIRKGAAALTFEATGNMDQRAGIELGERGAELHMRAFGRTASLGSRDEAARLDLANDKSAPTHAFLHLDDVGAELGMSAVHLDNNVRLRASKDGSSIVLHDRPIAASKGAEE